MPGIRVVSSHARLRRTFLTGALSLSAWAGFSGIFAVSASAQSADSLPAFRPDSVNQNPFKKVEAGPSPFSAATAASPKSGSDSAAPDTVTDRLLKRRPAVSVYLGVDFMDFDAKETFKAGLQARLAQDSLKLLQDYESVHLAFPIGIQAVLPISGYLDLVAKTHSYWYKQTAVLGDAASNHAGDEWYAVQSNLAGLGLRYYIPPTFLSVTGGLSLYAQGVLFWNLGNAEIYTPYGSARADFEPFGSGYEIVFGLQHALTGPWQVTGSLGFLHQDYSSGSAWSDIMVYAVPAGNVHWGSSAIQASLNLWYHFGVVSPAATPSAAQVPPGPVPTGPATGSSSPLPPVLPTAAPVDSTRHF